MAGLPPIWTLVATALSPTGGSARYGAPAADPILSVAARNGLWPAAGLAARHPAGAACGARPPMTVENTPKPVERSIPRRRRAEELGWLIFLLMTTLPFLVRILAH